MLIVGLTEDSHPLIKEKEESRILNQDLKALIPLYITLKELYKSREEDQEDRVDRKRNEILIIDLA